ncbi:MAG: T9SS type A sorting domain-containing protein [Ignavibacteria bacterium]|nr:T9SS type A sorting domain-containing protein [Ignavibacteria bacterium]
MKINYFRNGFSKIAFLILALILFTAGSNIHGTTHTVLVQDFSFTPANINVSVGDTVRWQWVNGIHTTTCNGTFPGTSLPNGAAPWDSEISSSTPVFSYVVTVAGSYNYVCQPHAPDMSGTITAGGGSVLLTENFSYPVGDSLGAHGWVSFSGGATNYLAVTSPGLVYSGYPLSNIGNATTVLANGQDAYKDFSSADSTGELYVSFMVNVSSIQSAGDYFTALLPPTSTTLYTARFYVRDSAGFRFGLSKSTATQGGIFYTQDTYSLNTTYLVVLKVKRNPGTTDDEYSAFIFSSGIPSTEPSTPSIGPVTGLTNDNIIGRVALRQGSSSNAGVEIVDGIQVSKNWSDFATSITNYENIVSDSYELYQNYPNPFNPATSIKFNIAEKGFINLTVFDALGKEVQTLVNDSKESGLYTVRFNGGNLNSGIYFYRLTYSGNNGKTFTETKKLLLIK